MLQIDAYASYIAAFTVFWRLQCQHAISSWELVRLAARNVSRTASEVHERAQERVLRVVCAISAAARARGVEKRGPRSEVCHASEWLCLELLSIILGQVEERFTSLLVAVLMRRSGVIYADRALSKLYT